MYYTAFTDNPEVRNKVILFDRKSEAESHCKDNQYGYTYIRGDFSRIGSYHTEEGQERILHYIRFAMEKSGRYYLDGNQWRYRDHTDDELLEGMRKMTFSDMVKEQRTKNYAVSKYRRPSRLKVFGQTYDLKSTNGWFQVEPDTDTATGTQYQMCGSLKEFWENYFEGEGQDPDNMTHVYYTDGTTWNSNDYGQPKRTGVQSAVISTGWGFICYNCTPTRYQDEYGEWYYDIEMN